MLDPVTQQPRFGPKMLTKVQDMLRRYDDVKLAVEDGAPLRQQVETKSEQLAQVQAEREKEQADRKREAREAERATELARAHEQERLQQEALARDAEQRRLEQARIDALAAAANKKREQRELERVQEERLRLEEEERRARLNALIPLGKEGLERSIAMLRESTGDATRFRQSMEKLLAVVGNICSSPENAAFRHIPKENAHFHADLGQYEGGYQCLLALGFRELQQGDDNEPKLVFVLEVGLEKRGLFSVETLWSWTQLVGGAVFGRMRW
ncbi:hypothetical protein BBJ28_00008325 [Nothophytophthora sp. Chile5]|nr:hypothetical protein BBJ28_00008325 [Nothophytophthora sp. Chile5]